MYAKYAFAVVMAAVAVNAEEQELHGSKSCDSWNSSSQASCAHSSCFRSSCGIPSSCGFESSCCPSDKKVFETLYTGDNAVKFVRFYPEGATINGAKADAASDFAKVGEGEEAKDFKFHSSTGAFKVGEEAASGPVPEAKDGAEALAAGEKLSAGAIIVGWQSEIGSFLLSDPKEAQTLDLGKNAKSAIGFWVLSKSMNQQAASDSATHAEGGNTDPVETPTEPETKPEDVKPEEPEPKSSMMMWYIIGGVVVVVIIAVVIGYFVMAGGDDAEEEEETDEEAAEEA